jgi:2-polyprenyl-3-methyl-5-hydroxy-6-metoxy-1,4-benzoquinol methylase
MSNYRQDYGWTDEITESSNYIFPALSNILNLLNIKRVCDLGSGNGFLANQLYLQGYYVAGVEVDEKGVSLSKAKYPNINFYNLSIESPSEDLLLKEGYFFDAVISTEVVEHLFNPQHLPQFAKKVLTPGGYLIISTPYHGYLKNLMLSIFDKWDSHHTSLWNGGHIKFWSRKTLTSLLEDNGFHVIGFKGVGRFNFMWKSMILIAQAT